MIGERIKELRAGRGLTQVGLARAINVTQSAIAKYEKGAAVPSDEVKLLLANYFGVSLDFLIGKAGAFASDDENAEAQLLSAYRCLNAAGRKQLDKYISFLLADPEYTKELSASAI